MPTVRRKYAPCPARAKSSPLKTLLGGWISDEDMDAIGKICRSVLDPADGRAIRQGINLLDFSSLGQRTQMRVFLSRMP
jgi:hypothetical protein